MKKSITLLLVLFFIIIGLPAANSTVSLNGNVTEVDYVLSLFYGNNDITNSVSPSVIGSFDLQNDSQTGDFTIYLSGNQNKKQTINVKVTAEPFKLQDLAPGESYVEGTNQLDVALETHSGTPITSGRLYKTRLSGFYENFAVAGFRITWDSSSATLLDAGPYVSDVLVEYSVN